MSSTLKPHSVSKLATPEEIVPSTTEDTLTQLLSTEYAAGFITEVETDSLPPGLDEACIHHISQKKNEPDFMLAWRLQAYRHWLTLKEPHWAKLHYPEIDYQKIIYYSAPKPKKQINSLQEVDPAILETYEKLGISLQEQERLEGVVGANTMPNVAIDAVFDSVSVATTFKERLAKEGIIFCSFSEGLQKYPELIQKYLGSVVPYTDNFFACLNSAVFTDGSFCYIPKDVRCPMELSTYFRINAALTGQFERTLIVAEAGSTVSYLEGCTAPRRDENQLHAAVVELIALDNAEIKYSTVQNWYPGDKEGKGGIYNFVTKRGLCKGRNSKISWTQVETGSAITWKYPSVVLQGEGSQGKFYSIAVSNHHQQADTGTKMIHLAPHTKSTIISKGISAGQGKNTYRGLVRVRPTAKGAQNYTQCDSLILSHTAEAHTFPTLDVQNQDAKIEHEASTSKVSEEQLFYCQSRGLNSEAAIQMIVNGFCKQVLNELPMEFAVEAQKLLNLSIEGIG